MTKFTPKEAESLRETIFLVQYSARVIDDPFSEELMRASRVLETLMELGRWGWVFNDSTNRLEFMEYPEQNAA